jgi:hypothetical protein
MTTRPSPKRSLAETQDSETTFSPYFFSLAFHLPVPTQFVLFEQSGHSSAFKPGEVETIEFEFDGQDIHGVFNFSAKGARVAVGRASLASRGLARHKKALPALGVHMRNPWEDMAGSVQPSFPAGLLHS